MGRTSLVSGANGDGTKGSASAIGTPDSRLYHLRNAIERQLAHSDSNKTRAAYFAQYLPERRRMMQAWADYLDRLRADSTDRSKQTIIVESEQRSSN